MAVANAFLPSINAGEFSPKLEARIDFEKYPFGAKRLKNAMLLPQGGWYRRPGFRYVASTKSNGDAFLVPFTFDVTDAYILEVGDGYMRFIRRQGQITVADTDASITNGTFGSNISGWTDQSTGSASISHNGTFNAMSLNGSAGDTAWAEQSVTTTSTGVVHVLRFRTRGVPGLEVKVQVGSSSQGAQLFEETALGVAYGNSGGAQWAYHTVSFTPSASPFYVQFKNDNNILDSGENILVDSVELLDDVPLEIETPWAAADLADLKFVQSGDVVYFTHPDYPVFKLERRGHRTWSLVQVYWNDGPWGEVNPDVDLVDKQLAPNPDLLTGMADWDDSGSSGGASTTRYDGSQQIIQLDSTDSTVSATAETEVPTGFRQGTSTRYVAHFLTVGGMDSTAGGTKGTALRVGTSSGAQNLVSDTDYPAGWHTISYTTATANNHFYRFRHSSNAETGGVGGLFVYAEDAHLMHPSGTTGSITVNARGFAPFKSSDVGRYIRFEFPGREPGWGIITAFNSTSQVTLQVRRKIPRALPTESWRFGEWSDRTGYPRTMAFFEGRSVLANNAENIRTMWFSQALDLENMRPDSFIEGGNTVEDDDALNFTLASPTANDIQWLTALQQLVIGTLGGPWIAESDGAVLTPSDRTFRQQTTTKISGIAPLLIGNAIVFVDQSRTRLFDLGFQFETNAYVAADLTQLAEHVSSVQMAEVAFQQDPDPVVWMRRDTDTENDGQLYVLAYNRVENIVGWSRLELGGTWTGHARNLPAVESIAIIPGSNDSNQDYDSGDRDEVWVIVKRTVNSSTVRYIEVMEKRYRAPYREDYSTESAWVDAVQADQQNAFYVDSGITYSGGSTSTITGLDHLEGETVKVLNGGQVEADKTVSSGQITLDNASGGNVVHVGLGFTSEYESLKVHYGARAGTGIGKPKTITGFTLVLLDTGKFEAGVVEYDTRSGRREHTKETVDFSRNGASFNDTTLSTWEKVLNTHRGRYSTDPRVWVTCSEPLPMTVLGVGPNIDLHESQASRK